MLVKVRLIKIMFSHLEMVCTNKINNHIPIKHILCHSTTRWKMNEKSQTETFDSDKNFQTFEHSNFLKFAFRKIEQGVRVKRSIVTEGTHQIGECPTYPGYDLNEYFGLIYIWKISFDEFQGVMSFKFLIFSVKFQELLPFYDLE